MQNYKKYLFLVLLTISFDGYGQDIDSSILSQLTPEQIEMAKDIYSDENFLDKSDEELPVIDESLEINRSTEDANEILGKKYGYDFFSSIPTSLTAVGDLPLPSDYKISLRDQFTVILSGSKDAIFNLNVKLDGTILFPELGAISVVGLSLKEVKDKLSLLIKQSYIGVNIDISMQNLSAKKITIVGAVKTPGTYLVNPFSTITSSLAYSGGISEMGSLRDIKLIRNNKEIFSFDLYDLLIKGDRSKDITIEAGDTLLINAASQFIEITGAVKRPGIYEILEGEILEDIIDFALGFNSTANKSNISIKFIDFKQAAIVQKNVTGLDQSLDNALSVNVFNYVSEATSNIQVFGAVEEPGFYEIKKYKDLKSLIDNLKFVDVYPWLAVLEQFDENKLSKSVILFNLNDASTFNSIKLLPNSRVYFININNRLSYDDDSFDLDEISIKKIRDYELTLNHKEGDFKLPVYGKFEVKTFVDFLGLDMSDVDDYATYVSPLEDIVSYDSYHNMNFTAKKYNTVSFRSLQNNLITVSIRGAVEYPGVYTLTNNSSIKDLYKLAGSFKKEAFLEGIVLTRDIIRERQMKSLETLDKEIKEKFIMNQKEGNISNIQALQELSQTIEPENLGRLAGDFSPKSETTINTILLDGDALIVPKIPNSINVYGEVLNPLAFEYSKNLSVSAAINQAGGFKQFSDKRRIYIIKANGIVKKPSKNIFTKNYRLEPGDTIVVPRKIITSEPGLKALIPITQILSDLAFSAAAIDNLTQN
jgi:protein involved in polysaccharide export with SLBB domain